MCDGGGRRQTELCCEHFPSKMAICEGCLSFSSQILVILQTWATSPSPTDGHCGLSWAVNPALKPLIQHQNRSRHLQRKSMTSESETRRKRLSRARPQFRAYPPSNSESESKRTTSKAYSFRVSFNSLPQQTTRISSYPIISFSS